MAPFRFTARIHRPFLAVAFWMIATPSNAFPVRDLFVVTGTGGHQLGYSVASAGDVNGDGYDDVIIGAPYDDSGGSDTGRAYLHFGGVPADGIADVVFTGEVSGDVFGASVSGAGDVDFDGYADIIIGAPGYNSGAGRVYVYYGGPQPDNTADLVLTGTATELLGISVSSAGDVNGDGYADMIVGAYLNGAGGVDAGRASVYFGGSPPNTVADLVFTGGAGDALGFSVSTAGDVNGDGYADMIVGSVGSDTPVADAGNALVYYGGPGADNVADWTLVGEATNDFFGISVAAAGDVNGDGYDDVIVGAEGNEVGGIDAGRAYVFYGGNAGDSVPDLVITGMGDGDNVGRSVSTAGDWNADGYADLLVGSSNFEGGNLGRASIYYGGPGTDDVADVFIEGEFPGDELGYAVSRAGDVNGDGYGDIAVGAAGFDLAGDLAGRAYVFTSRPYEVLAPNGGERWFAGQPHEVRWLGRDLADVDLSSDGGATWAPLRSGVGGGAQNQITVLAPALVTEFALLRVSRTGQPASFSNSDLGNAVFSIVQAPTQYPLRTLLQSLGAADSDVLGVTVSTAGDVNGDGCHDLIVGAPGATGAGPTMGHAYVYFGGPGADAVADLTLTGEEVGDQFGLAVSGGGDVNADGFADVVVGAYRSNAGGALAGRAYVYFGGRSPDAIPDLVLTGEAPNDGFGVSVSTGGDLNGDGSADVAVGAWGNSSGGALAGRAYVYFGGLGVDAVPDLTLTGSAAGDQLGQSVAFVGDVNGDTWSDLAVGAPNHDGAGVNAGRVYVLYGGAGADATPDVILSGLNQGDAFGSSVGGGCDINGDGYAEILIGAPGSQAGGDGSGRAYVRYGRTVASSSLDLTLTGEAQDQFGTSISAAGDVNADGYGDFIVGAPLSFKGGYGAGRALLFLGGASPDTRADFEWIGSESIENLGRSVASAGDFNQDGYADIAVGAPGFDSSGVNRGRAFVLTIRPFEILSPNGGETWVLGGTRSVRWAGRDRCDVDISFDAGGTWSTLARGVGGADVNTLNAVVPGPATMQALIRVTTANQIPNGENTDASNAVFRIVSDARPPAAASRLDIAPFGAGNNDEFGVSVGSAGDVNSDGYADVIVGAPGNDTAGADAGAAYLYLGGPGADDVADLTLIGEAAGDRFGTSVSGAGDVNGDGFDDLIVGAPENGSAGASAGRAYVYFGSASPDAVVDIALTGEAAGHDFGTAVGRAGDVNGDGHADFLVGAPGFFGNSGRAYVYFGGPSVNATADWTASGASAERFGHSASTAGDIDGDGFGDIIVGAYANASMGVSSGAAYVLLGGANPDPTPDLTLKGAAQGDFFGQSVSAAGDVNGDGYDDVIVGANGSDVGGNNRGRAYLFLGGPGRDDVADVEFGGEFAGDGFGVSVAVAGDVNGDGFSDVIVGAFQNDAGSTNAGRAYLYFGGHAPDAAADHLFTGSLGSSLGISVASAGDVNGDGFRDVVVGAQTASTPPGFGQGRAYAFDMNRYHVVSPNGGETWNVGAAKEVSWQGAEPADVWLSTNGGQSFSLLESGVGGQPSNTLALQVPHAPTKFARLRVTPSNAAVSGEDKSDSLFTIQTSVALLALLAAPLPDRIGTAEITWKTDPGPEDLAGYRLEKAPAGGTWSTVMPLSKETSYTDPSAGAGGARYRLFAVNGFGEELMLGETWLRPLAPLAAWPTPYRGGELTISFATASGFGGSPAATRVALFDVRGRLVRTIASGRYAAGYRTAVWDGRDARGRRVAAGIYFLRSRSGGEETTVKLSVLR